MRKLALLTPLLVAAAALASHAGAHHTACPTADSRWCHATGGVNLSGPAAMRAPTFTRAFVGNGTQLLALDPETGAPAVGYSAPTVGSIDSRVMPVELGSKGSGVYRTFIASTNGYVYSINSQTGACMWKTYTGRTNVSDAQRTVACSASVQESCANDTLSATPLIWLGRFANPTYGPTDDRLIVGTRYVSGGGNCGTTGSVNRRLIINASTGAVIANVLIAASTFSGMTPDYSRGIAFATGTSSTGNSFSVYNPTTGQALCSQAFGSIQATPLLSYNTAVPNRVYVANSAGTSSELRAVDLSNCTQASCNSCSEMYSTTVGAAVQLDFSVDPRGASSNRLFVTAADGHVHTFVDGGSSFTDSGTYTPEGGALATSVSPVSFANDRFYVGQNDGRIAQISLSGCTAASCPAEAIRTVQANTTIGDIFHDANAAYTSHWLYAGNDAGLFVRMNIPF